MTSPTPADGRSDVRRRVRHAREEIPADAVFLLTGYRADSDLMRRAGVRLNERDAPVHDPETFETNVPGLFVAGGAIAGVDTGTIFIENGRFHGEKIVERDLPRRHGDADVQCATFDTPGVRAIMIFISSSSTSDSARDAQAVLLEQRLLFERLEVEILRQRVDQIFVGHRRRRPRTSAPVPLSRPPARAAPRASPADAADRGAVVGGKRRLDERLDERAAIAALVIFAARCGTARGRAARCCSGRRRAARRA